MSATPDDFQLDRLEAVPALLRDVSDCLIVTGLAGAARDVAAFTDDGDNVYTMAGAMGAAVAMGLGLALAQPKQRIIVVTGDGELLMNVGALATVAVQAPANLSILCVDNGHYGETGYQRSHTGVCVDLAKMAEGAGIRVTKRVVSENDIAEGARVLKESNGPSFVLLRVKPTDPPRYKRLLDPSACRLRFRRALLGRP